MNWFKENPVPAGILGAGVLAAAALSYLAFQASAREGEALAELARQTSRLEGLQRRQPPATPAGLASAEKSLSDYTAAVEELASSLAAKEEPLDTTSPEKFQDELRRAADETAKTAASKNTTLPDPFLFGFEEFQSQLPPPDQTPELHREFKVARRLVDSLLAIGISSIDLFQRGRPAEAASKAAQAAPGAPPAQPGNKNGPAIAPPEVVPIRIAFTAKQDALINALNAIPADSQFLVLRSVALENTNPEPPPRQAGTQESPSPQPALGAPSPGETPKERLDVVLGREMVKATLDLELLDFAAPKPKETQPAAQPATPPPPAAN